MRADHLGFAAIALLLLACSRDEAAGSRQSSQPDVRGERVELRVDDTLLSGPDAFAIVEPVYWSADIYDSVREYDASLRRFSPPQRLLYALHWYIAEVNNGGHQQFYANSTGIVWPDALAALEAIEVSDGADILRESTRRLGGSPSREHAERNSQLEQLQPNFEDLDDRFYALQDQIDLNARMLEYARSRPADFYFSGVVERPVFDRPVQ